MRVQSDGRVMFLLGLICLVVLVFGIAAASNNHGPCTDIPAACTAPATPSPAGTGH